ncbi:hypothetical protein [Winogradskyella sp. MH6]|uniref:hypothetical protein n=1 Tax=Winogradskyella sp. MH6 TaxID=2929510 RepID=UPI001FB1E752|nr:hypothetical protein [Winogradskyella sp. MH6]
MLVLVAIIAFSSTVSASTNLSEKVDEPNLISETVSKLLERPYFQLNEDINTKVEIAINKDKEIVVLSVDTKDKKVENYIKSRLNYKKIPNDVIVDGVEHYTIPIKMLKSERL